MSRHAPLLILSSIPAFTQAMVWAAGLAGRPCWVMTPQPGGHWRWSSTVLGIEPIDQDDLVRRDRSLLRAIHRLCEREKVGSVLAADTRSTRFLLDVAADLPDDVTCFPLGEREQFEILYDKWSFAILLEKLHLPAPRTALINSLEDVAVSAIHAPAMIKPTQGEGGVGIEMANTEAEIHAIVKARIEQSLLPVVLQTFIPGDDIDLSLLADKGHCVAWTIQQTAGRKGMRFVDHPEVLDLGRALVSETGYHGVMHLDMRIDSRSGRVVFIESNPRFWGSLPYSAWAGVNFLDLGLRMANGEEISALFSPAVTVCPYLAVTRRSLPRALMGGWPVPNGLSLAQRRAWRMHHGFGSGEILGLVEAGFRGMRQKLRAPRAHS